MTAEPLNITEHLDELKHRLKIAFLSYVVILAIMLLAPADPAKALTFTGTYEPFVGFFLARVKLDLLPGGWELIAGPLTAPIEIYLVSSGILAAVFNAPIFAYETVKFVSPALTEKEKDLAYPFVGASSLLFILGVLFGYFLLAKFLFIAIGPFFQTAQATPIINVTDFYTVVFLTIGLSGVAFTSPSYVFMLIRFRVIRAETFRHNRVIVWVIVYVATAIVTPDGGPVLDIILFLPIIALLELAVWLGGRSVARQEAEGDSDRCRYCGARLEGRAFCPSCGRSAA